MMRRVFALIGALALTMTLVGAGIAVAGLGAEAPVSSAPSSASQSIEVSASGQASARPDLGILRVGVEATADDPTKARTQVADNVSAVRSALAEMGIDAEQVRTVDYNLWEDDDRRHAKDEPRATTYRARHVLLIEVRDIDRLGAVIDAAVDAGVTNIHDVRYTLAADTRRELRRDALSDAMENARGQAETLADESGLQVTGVSRVSTTEVSFPGIQHDRAVGGAGGGTTIETGPVSVSANVAVVYNAST